MLEKRICFSDQGCNQLGGPESRICFNDRGESNQVDWRETVIVGLVQETEVLPGWDTELLLGHCGVW
jgi:hypothetical protein